MEKTRSSEKVAAILVVSQQNGVPIGTKLHVFIDFGRSPDRECWSRRGRRHSWRVGVIGPYLRQGFWKNVRGIGESANPNTRPRHGEFDNSQ